MTQIQSRLSLIIHGMRDWTIAGSLPQLPDPDQADASSAPAHQASARAEDSGVRHAPLQPGEEIERRRLSSQSYRSYRLWLFVLLALALAGAPASALAQPPEPHQYIEQYDGPATCEACHGDVTGDVVHTVHYSWAEKMDQYTPLTASIPRINWLSMLNEQLDIAGGCGRCHIGDGSLPKPADEVTAADRAGIDCLICHSPVYDASLRAPVQGSDGAWTLTQDRTVQAARQAKRPSTQNCLFCHRNAGGETMSQLGADIAPVADTHGEGSGADVHTAAGLACVDCHASQDHKVLGFGPNLVSRDLPDQRLACASCHTEQPHQDPLIDQHVRLDCRACHIPATGGLVSRDWTATPVYDPVAELYSPLDDARAFGSVTPVYRWYNGQAVRAGETWPGSRSDLTARIQPFKEFSGTVPVDAASGDPIPLKLDVFYVEGDLEKAIRQGAEEAGARFGGQWVADQLATYYQLSHGVVAKEDALACQDCHIANGRIDFGEMGYTSDEVAMLTTVSTNAAVERQPLQMEVVIPAAQPLPTPVNLSGDLEAERGVGIHIPWNPILALVVAIAIGAAAALWLRRQKPKPPVQQA